MSEWAAGLRMAVGTLTIIPSGSFNPSRAAAKVAVLAAPLAILPVALVAGGGIAVGRAAAVPQLLIGAGVCGWIFFATRGMHLDGTADVVDALAAGWDRERAITVMKRGDVGPMGAAALTLVIIAQVVAWGQLTAVPHGWLLAAAAITASRVCLAAPCTRGIPAMDGSSMGKVFAEAVPRWVTLLWWCLAAALLAAAGAYAGLAWWHGALAAIGAAAICWGIVSKLRRVCGGVNGDAMGACIELGLTTMVVILACG